MPNTTETKKKLELLEDRNTTKIEAFLMGPRKKRKIYVLFALGENFDPALAKAMQEYVKKTHTNFHVASPRNPDELVRQFARNISLLVINDELADRTVLMNVIKAMKDRRRHEVPAVLFLTRNPDELIEVYNKELFAYHELDELIVYPNSPRAEIMALIKNGLENHNKRRARRYKVKVQTFLLHMTDNLTHSGQITDMSMHGAMIEGEKDMLFKQGDQLKLSIPISQFIPYDQGDYLKLSGRVRRIFIPGNRVAVSFEYVTPHQSLTIAKLLIKLVDREFTAQTSRLKLQFDKEEANLLKTR